MAANNTSVKVGDHRPVYMWAGPGTIRMNRLKFMNAPVDEFVHHEGHSQTGAQRMAEAGFNWAYLMYNWGFPPEIEVEDWEAFNQAVKHYQTAGMKTFGYIQTSNCAYQGSYQDKDWYALDARGRKIYYYTGRYMTCWLHPDWKTHLQAMVKGVIDGGADGVFFDNPWHASQPLSFANTWMGGAGCYCPRCQQAFSQSSGHKIPTKLNPDRDRLSQDYLRWRAELVTNTLKELADYARSLKPDVVISANNFDAIMRPSYLIYGIDLPGLSGVQDILMIEDFCLPRWEPKDRVLINNALTLRTALALSGTTPLTTDPYDKGIGFDQVYPPERFVQGIVEAAACGVPMVVKGTEFFDQGQFTLLTAEHYAPQRAALKKIHSWLEENSNLFSKGENRAPIGLLFPGEDLWFNFHRLSPIFFGAGQALIEAGLPWKVINQPDHLNGVNILLTFGDLPAGWNLPDGIKSLSVPSLPGWELPAPSLAAKHDWLRAPIAFFVEGLFRAYFHSRLARRVLDGIGLASFFLHSPLFKLPSAQAAVRLLKQIDEKTMIQVASPEPVLIEIWQREGKTQIHLVNYAPVPQQITLNLPENRDWVIHSPDSFTQTVSGESVQIELQRYVILVEE